MKEIIIERPNLFEPNVYISFYMELHPNVKAEDLATAVKAAYKANEMTLSKVILKSNGAAYYEKMAHSACKVAVLENDWQEILRENEKLPFDLENGEFVRTFINPKKENTSLLIMAHHLAGDGKSIVYLIEDIMNALSGKELAYKPANVFTRETFSMVKRLPFAVKFYVAASNKKWVRDGGCVFTWKDYDRVHNSYWKEATSWVRYKTLSREETALIKGRAKKIGVSVNTYVITAFLQADERNCVVGIPVSVREDGDKAMSNLISGISISHKFSGKHTFSENAKQIHQKIFKALKTRRWFILQFIASLSPTLIDAVLLNTHRCYQNRQSERLGRIMGYIGNRTRDIGITNLTELDIPAVYDICKIEKLVFIPPVVSYARNIIGVSTMNHEMTITYHYTGDNQSIQEDFFDRGVSNLFF